MQNEKTETMVDVRVCTKFLHSSNYKFPFHRLKIQNAAQGTSLSPKFSFMARSTYRIKIAKSTTWICLRVLPGHSCLNNLSSTRKYFPRLCWPIYHVFQMTTKERYQGYTVYTFSEQKKKKKSYNPKFLIKYTKRPKIFV